MTAEPRIRVVMVSAGFWPAVGGAERQALELSRALRARGADVLVLTRLVGCAAPREEVRGVPVRRLRVFGTGAVDSVSFLFGALGWLLKHGGEYDAIHAHLAGSPALAAALAGRWLGKPVLVKLGGGRGIGELAVSSRTVFGRVKLRLLALLKPRFLAVVPDLAAEAREHLAGAVIEVLPNGVDVGRFKAVPPAEKKALREKLGWTGTVFLYTGRLSWEKRLPWFAAIWEKASAGHDAVLILAGAGPEKIPESPRVRILSSIDDTSELYAAADVFILPSVSEGLSNSLLEAMSSGLPVVASAVGGTAETIENGKTGLLFGKDDEKEATAQIQRILNGNELRVQLGTGARHEVERRYSIARVVERLLELYRGES
jgi:glycosyltransferase involved in cell wall biosynthesis